MVPGDLVILEEGDAAPADLRLIQVSQLQVIESILTGESLPVQKKVDAIKASRVRVFKILLILPFSNFIIYPDATYPNRRL